MITDKHSLEKPDFTAVIWGAVISYLASAVFLHSAYPEALEFTAKSCFLLLALYFYRKVGGPLPAILASAHGSLASDTVKAAKYFAVIIIGGAVFAAIISGLLGISSYLSPTMARYLEQATSSPFPVQILPPAYNSPLRTIFHLSTLCLIAPVAEEIFFRRFLFVSLRKAHTKTYAIAVSSIIFGAVHFEGFFVAAAMGAILAYVYEKEERLSIPILIHAMKNAAAIVAGLAYHSLN